MATTTGKSAALDSDTTDAFGRRDPLAKSTESSESTVVPFGTKVGKIVVVDRLAVGGMGEIYVGYDEKLKRRVALKALRADRLDSESRGRFLREARILSQLQDPKICQIYDFVEGDGTDFLVLELIEGQNLTEALAAGVDDSAKMRIAEQLAEVLQKAHAKGVVHRDLKPGNVMITPSGSIKVLDFGLAYTPEEDITRLTHHGAVGEPPGDRSALFRTQLGRVMGTVSYMSPEQAHGERVTAASDMYSLGLLLQALFTGKSPYGSGNSPIELLAKVQDGVTEPATGIDADLAVLIEHLKAQAPEARPTAADAVERLRAIADKPRRRLRWAAAITAILVLVLGVLKYTLDLRRERNLALESEGRAQAARREAETVVTFLEEMFEVAKPLRAPRQDVTAREVLDRASERIGYELVGEPLVQARLMLTMGSVYDSIGDYERAGELLQRSLEIRRERLGPDAVEVADSALRRGQNLNYLGHYDEAIELMQTALAIDERHFGEDDLRIARDALQLADVFQKAARYDEAEPLARRALAIREQHEGPDHPSVASAAKVLGSIYRARGQWEEAEDAYRRALEIRERTQPGHREIAALLYNLAVIDSRLGRLDEAEPLYLRALALFEEIYGPDHNEVANCLNGLAILYRRRGAFDEAEPLFHRAMDIWSEKLGPEHINIGLGYNNLASLYLQKEDFDRATELYRRALEIFETAHGDEHPNVAMSLHNLGRLLAGQGELDEAEGLLQRALRIDEDLSGADHPDVASDLSVLANISRDRGKTAEAEAMYIRALKIYEANLEPEHQDLIELRLDYALLLRSIGREAEAAIQETLAHDVSAEHGG